MATHYLLDAFTTPITSSRIIDVREPSNGQSVINGTFVVRIPDGVSVQKPTSFSDLITKKYAGLLAFYTFTHVTFDDLVDSTGANTGSSIKSQFGSRSSIAVFPSGTFQSTTAVLASTPAEAIITWETYSLTDSDDKSSRETRTYTEVPSSPSNITCQVSFDGGVTYNATTDGAVLTIPGASQGPNFIIKLTNASTGKLYLGSWAVIY